MFNPGLGGALRTPTRLRHANWEFDVRDISVENCKIEEDPLGYRVVFHKIPDKEHYCIGASHLYDRLRKLSRAGFDAPMTKKAINIIDQKRLRILPKVV